jgi:hypothetical protein
MRRQWRWPFTRNPAPLPISLLKRFDSPVPLSYRIATRPAHFALQPKAARGGSE